MSVMYCFSKSMYDKWQVSNKSGPCFTSLKQGFTYCMLVPNKEKNCMILKKIFIRNSPVTSLNCFFVKREKPMLASCFIRIFNHFYRERIMESYIVSFCTFRDYKESDYSSYQWINDLCLVTCDLTGLFL